MLNRRKVLFGAAALMAAALPAMPVMASDSRLLADILAGVSDALTRDYIRRHYQEGRWDGSHWMYFCHVIQNFVCFYLTTLR